MKIDILASESRGVRGLCCTITTKDRNILIDPGIALGYFRYRLLPHPFQVAVDEKRQKDIVRAWCGATDIVISHFHGDHTPLSDANPYQLSIHTVARCNRHATLWAKGIHLSQVEKRRKEALSEQVPLTIRNAEAHHKGILTFSQPVPHGKVTAKDTVIMTRIAEERVFVHASDIQFLCDEAVDTIIEWTPDIVLASGPPLYISRLCRKDVTRAVSNMLRLARHVDTLVVDHHLVRDRAGIELLDRLAERSDGTIMCAADFMGKPRLFLEADRKRLYEEMPVSPGWHDAYAAGNADTLAYRTESLFSI